MVPVEVERSRALSVAAESVDTLVTRGRARDPVALAELYDMFHDYSKAFAYLHLRNHHDAEDVVQSVWLKVFGALNQFRGTGKFSSWLCAIILNECRALHKRRSRTLTLDGELEIGRRRDPGGAVPHNIDADPEREQMGRQLRRHLDLLPKSYRQILLMRYVHELGCDQIAALLNISPSAVRSRTMRACAELRVRVQTVGEIQHSVQPPAKYSGRAIPTRSLLETRAASMVRFKRALAAGHTNDAWLSEITAARAAEIG